MARVIHACQCAPCRGQDDHAERDHHQQLNLVLSRLDEQTRRWSAALEAMRRGHGGDLQVSRITGMDVGTISQGRKELAAGLAGRPDGRIRLTGAGRHPAEDLDPGLEPALNQQLASETAGDPMSLRKWTRSTLRSLSLRMTRAGHPISRGTVGRLLKKQGYSLKVNAKRKNAGCDHPDRNEQFLHVEAQIRDFQATGDPVISVDTKKRADRQLQKCRVCLAPGS